MLGIQQIVAPGNCILLLFRIPYILYLLSTYISATSVFFNFMWMCKEQWIIFSSLFIPCPLMPTVLVLRRGLSYSAATFQPMRGVLVVTVTNDKRKIVQVFRWAILDLWSTVSKKCQSNMTRAAGQKCKNHHLTGRKKTFQSFFVYFVCWSPFCACCPFCISKRCLDSKRDSCRSK
jgi:hypothetical protein